MNLRVPSSTGILFAALATSLAVSALYHNGVRIQQMRLVDGPAPVLKTRIGDVIPAEPEIPVKRPRTYGSSVTEAWRVYLFVTPGCSPCWNLISDIQSGAYRDVPGELVLIVAGWWPFGSLDAYCRRNLPELPNRCRVLPDEDAAWTKAVLGPTPDLPSSLVVDASGRVRGFVKGNRADLPALLLEAITGRSLPVSVRRDQSLLRHANLLDAGGVIVPLAELTAHGTSIVTLVRSGCPGCTLRMKQLAYLRPQPALRVVFIRLEDPGAGALDASGERGDMPVYTVGDSASRRTVRAMAGGSSVPRTLVFRDGTILLRETKTWTPG